MPRRRSILVSILFTAGLEAGTPDGKAPQSSEAHLTSDIVRCALFLDGVFDMSHAILYRIV